MGIIRAIIVFLGACVEPAPAVYHCEVMQTCEGAEPWRAMELYDIDADTLRDATSIAEITCDRDMIAMCTTGPSSCEVSCK